MPAILILCLVAALPLAAQSVYTGLGARAEGMGNATAALADAYSVFHNPAGMAWESRPTASVAYSLTPSLEGANRIGAAALFPIGPGTGALSVFRFGDELYSESLVSISFANRLGIAALGGRLNYLQYRAEGFGIRNALTLNLGGLAELTSTLRLGAWIHNLNRPKLSTDGDHAPVRMATGLTYLPTDNLTLVTELEKELDYPTRWKLGMEYAFRKRLYARSGFNFKPNSVFFGMGFLVRKIQFDYALQYNPYLRTVHQGSVVIKPSLP